MCGEARVRGAAWWARCVHTRTFELRGANSHENAPATAHVCVLFVTDRRNVLPMSDLIKLACRSSENSGKRKQFELSSNASFAELQDTLQTLTSISPKRQKSTRFLFCNNMCFASFRPFEMVTLEFSGKPDIALVQITSSRSKNFTRSQYKRVDHKKKHTMSITYFSYTILSHVERAAALQPLFYFYGTSKLLCFAVNSRNSLSVASSHSQLQKQVLSPDAICRLPRSLE